MVEVTERASHDDDMVMREGMASSAPRASHHLAPVAMVPALRQHVSGQASRASSRAASSGPLAAAQELLRNPQPPLPHPTR